jgi:hypothetical protein
MNPCIFGAVFAFTVGDEPGIVAEYRFEFVVTLFAEFIPITRYR